MLQSLYCFRLRQRVNTIEDSWQKISINYCIGRLFKGTGVIEKRINNNIPQTKRSRWNENFLIVIIFMKLPKALSLNFFLCKWELDFAVELLVNCNVFNFAEQLFFCCWWPYVYDLYCNVVSVTRYQPHIF